jgi:hypothetical protein
MGGNVNKELTLKLVKRFPILYQDFYSSIEVSCMPWGFDHDAGWFNIIWQLSLAIEDELNYSWLQKKSFLFKKKYAQKWNDAIYKLSPVRQIYHKMEGSGTKEDPYHQVETHRDPMPWDEKIVNFLFGKETRPLFKGKDRIALKRLAWFPNTGFAVTQVKEKFGMLRFYAPGNDRIYDLIDLAERLSCVTCEVCGKYGKLRGHSWVRTLCNGCEEKKN